MKCDYYVYVYIDPRDGVRAGNNYLRPATVLTIHRLWQRGFSCIAIGQRLKVPRGLVSSICHGHSWGWLTGVHRHG
jgi:hypothetical protein